MISLRKMCQLILTISLFLHFFLSVVKEFEAALLLACYIYVQVIPSTKWRNATDWARLPPLTRTKGYALCTPAG